MQIPLVMTVFCVVTALGQSRAEIEARFGQPVNVYNVSALVWMSPEYAADGQVCRMTFHPRRFSATTNYLSNELTFEEFRNVIDLIVPDEVRGAQKEPIEQGSWNFGGGVQWVDFIYDRVTIEYVAGFRMTGPLVKSEPVTFPIDEMSKRRENPKPVKTDFSRYSGSTAEIVTVKWNDRKGSVNRFV